MAESKADITAGITVHPRPKGKGEAARTCPASGIVQTRGPDPEAREKVAWVTALIETFPVIRPHMSLPIDPLIQILVEDILVFAYCSDDQIDEDFSVEQLERIVGCVSAAGEGEVKRFLAVVRAMADEARENGQPVRAEQLDAMPRHMGLEG